MHDGQRLCGSSPMLCVLCVRCRCCAGASWLIPPKMSLCLAQKGKRNKIVAADVVVFGVSGTRTAVTIYLTACCVSLVAVLFLHDIEELGRCGHPPCHLLGCLAALTFEKENGKTGAGLCLIEPRIIQKLCTGQRSKTGPGLAPSVGSDRSMQPTWTATEGGREARRGGEITFEHGSSNGCCRRWTINCDLLSRVPLTEESA